MNKKEFKKHILEEVYMGLKIVKFSTEKYLQDVIEKVDKMYSKPTYLITNKESQDILEKLRFVQEISISSCRIQEDRLISLISHMRGGGKLWKKR